MLISSHSRGQRIICFSNLFTEIADKSFTALIISFDSGVNGLQPEDFPLCFVQLLFEVGLGGGCVLLSCEILCEILDRSLWSLRVHSVRAVGKQLLFTRAK
jgi:hypothetical protein